MHLILMLDSYAREYEVYFHAYFPLYVNFGS